LQVFFKCVPILLPTRKLYCFAGLSSFHSVLYSKKIRKEFNIDHHKKNIQLELYQAVAAHGKILLKTLSQNITISYPNVASQAVWLFIRLKETKETEEKNISLEDYNSHYRLRALLISTLPPTAWCSVPRHR